MFKSFIVIFLIFNFLNASENNKKLIYLVPDLNIPFWEIMSNGVKNKAKELNNTIEVFDSKNQTKTELENIIKAIKTNPAGIILTPTNSSACVTLLKFAKEANIPVVISDVGTDEGDYISYISSNNFEGAYKLGLMLSKKMLELNTYNKTVGIVAIPQTRINGKARTEGFIKALNENNIKGAGLKQINDFSEDEAYKFTKELIKENPNLGAVWIQTSNIYNGALTAIKESNKDILLISFDAEPIFVDLISKDVLVGTAMQQPYLMGEKAVETMNLFLNGKDMEKNIILDVLPISKNNIKEEYSKIEKNVLGIK